MYYGPKPLPHPPPILTRTNWIDKGRKDSELRSRRERKRLSLLRKTNRAFSVKQDIRSTHIDISIYVHIHTYVFSALYFAEPSFFTPFVLQTNSAFPYQIIPTIRAIRYWHYQCVERGKTEDGLALGVTENQTERVRDLLMAYLTPRRKGNQCRGPHLKYCRQAPEQEQQRVLMEECSLIPDQGI